MKKKRAMLLLALSLALAVFTAQLGDDGLAGVFEVLLILLRIVLTAIQLFA